VTGCPVLRGWAGALRAGYWGLFWGSRDICGASRSRAGPVGAGRCYNSPSIWVGWLPWQGLGLVIRLNGISEEVAVEIREEKGDWLRAFWGWEREACGRTAAGCWGVFGGLWDVRCR
jgi:hypothetical protein